MKLKIAILGTRGVPNYYGGFEHIAGYLSRGLVQRGHAVTVYNSSRHPYQQKEWHGVDIVHSYDPEKLLGMAGQFVYDFNCLIDARKRKFDIILLLGYTSSSIWGTIYPSDAIMINNMDGLEWQRTKYSAPTRAFLRLAERLAVVGSHYQIADSPLMKRYLDSKYDIKCKYIAYGTDLHPAQDSRVLKRYGLRENDYYMMMARMEPENNIETVLDGFTMARDPSRFLVVSDVNNPYGRKLVAKYRANPKIVFTGAIFNDYVTQSLTACCKLYFHGHSVGGTNPSLLSAMAADAPIAAHDNAFNRSILQSNALFFSDHLEVAGILDKKELRNEAFVRNNYATVREHFNWRLIIGKYEDFFIECYLKKHLRQTVIPIKETVLVH